MPYQSILIPAGIERNNTPFDTPNRYYDMNQVRVNSGTLEPIGGWQGLSTPLDSPIRAFQIWQNNTGTLISLAGTDNNLYVDTGTWSNITPFDFVPLDNNFSVGGYGTGPYGADDYGTPRTTPSPFFTPYSYWTMSNWGEQLILTANSDGRPFIYYSTGNVLVPPYPIGASFSTTANATINASTTGTTFNVTVISSGNIGIGQEVSGVGLPGPHPVTITNFISGSGGVGTYKLSANVGNISAETFTTFDPITTGPPSTCQALIVTNERHLMLLNYDAANLGYDREPYAICWSSQEDYTDFDFASLTNTAGFLRLNASTPLMYALTVPEGTLVFSETEVFLIRYTGQPFEYGGTDPISKTTLINPRSIVSYNGQVMWPTRSGFQQYSGGAVSYVECPIWNQIFGEVGDERYLLDSIWGQYRFTGGSLGRNSTEIWWFYPSVGNTECNRQLIYNYVSGDWFWGELERSAITPANAYQYPLLGGIDKKIYQHEYGYLADGASRTGNIWVETGVIPLGQMDQLTKITQMQIATGTGPASVEVTIFGSFTTTGAEYTNGPYLARTDGYTDVRTNYRYHRFRFTNIGDNSFSLGQWDVQIGKGSNR